MGQMEKQAEAPLTFGLGLVEKVKAQEGDEGMCGEGGIWKGTEEKERCPRWRTCLVGQWEHQPKVLVS